MPLSGIPRRLRRLLGPNGRAFLIALEHGIPAGPIPGLERPREILEQVRGAPETGIIANPGMVRHLPADIIAGRALVVHLSAGTLLGSSPTTKVLVATVERAVALGADAVAVQIHFGDAAEDRMVADAARVADEAHALGIPTLAMAYDSRLARTTSVDEASVAHAARAAAEIGADLVQVSYGGPAGGLRRIVHGCPVPLLIAGGPRPAVVSTWLESLRQAFAAGVAGISVGRALFASEDPASLAGQIADVVFDRELAPVPMRR